MTTKALLRTPFYAFHVDQRAKLVDFAGWEMPVQFSTVISEHKAVRERAGIFDISHMGQLWVAGPNARPFLQKIVTNDLSKLVPGKGFYALMCHEDGGIVDDLYIYCLESERYLVIVNASRMAADLQWMRGHAGGDLMLMEQPQPAAVALQGPAAAKIIGLFSADAVRLAKNEVADVSIQELDFVVARTGYTGEDGFEIFAPAGHLLQIYPQLLKKGTDYGLVPCGLGARDTLRLEMGYRLYGHDLDEKHTAMEAGLGWVVKLDKGDFIGRAALSKERDMGSYRRFLGFRLTERAVPRQGCQIFSEGILVGEVTSGTFSPSLEAGIAMGYVENDRFPLGSPAAVLRIHDRDVPAQVVPLPFLKKG